MIRSKLVAFSLTVFVLVQLNYLPVDSIPYFLCGRYKVKLLEVLTLLCNSTQTTSIAQRDSCQACFAKAASYPPGSTQLQSMSYCAVIYLNTTGYQVCAQNLATLALQAKPIPSVFKLNACSPGYCDFVRCIRRTNANILINACFLANLVNRDFNRLNDRISFYTNTTACILARMRCSILNPITGELQQQVSNVFPSGLTNMVGTAGFYHYNALQIAPNGDIKVVAFPPSIVTGDYFCTTSANLEQSNFDNSTCSLRMQ